MKREAIFAGAVLFGNALGQTAVTNGTNRAGVDLLFDAFYSKSHEVTISGSVTGKVKGAPRNGMKEGISILVRSKGRVYQVDLGPTAYVASQPLRINMGDWVKVTGSPVHLANKENFILARVVQKKKQVLTLRDWRGWPMWIAYQKNLTVAGGSSNPNTINGKIVGTSQVNVENQQEMAYQLQTADGLINIAAAPNWFLEQEGLGFKTGDDITVYTGAGPVNYGNGIILANGIYGYGGTVLLRPYGQPIWMAPNVITPPVIHTGGG